MYDEDDYLMLSGIQHFCFCRRQWALISLEQVWADDARTASGNLFHERVDKVSGEVRGDLVIRRAVRVSSSVLGLSGRCDVVEFIADPDGYAVSGLDGSFRIRPVEYKVGHRKVRDCDRMQLCAEAMALEESLGVTVDEGCLFYGAERRREIVPIDSDLRRMTEAVATEMHGLYRDCVLPEPIRTSGCARCSLQDYCIPDVDPHRDVGAYLSRMASQ